LRSVAVIATVALFSHFDESFPSRLLPGDKSGMIALERPIVRDSARANRKPWSMWSAKRRNPFRKRRPQP